MRRHHIREQELREARRQEEEGMDPGRRLQPEGKRKKKLKPLKKTRKKKNLTPTVAGAVTVEIAVIRSELVQNVLEGLLGDADLAVQDLGIARLM